MANNFKSVKELGSGGMGKVVLAEDVGLQRRVAVKVMHDSLAADETFRKSFIGEARAIARLRHPNIVRILTFSGENSRNLYLVMDYYAQGNLRRYMKKQQLALGDAVQIVRQIASGLYYAHQQNMIHRDVKPENILLEHIPDSEATNKLNAVLSDFGLVTAQTDTLVSQATPQGTLPYMPPEAFEPRIKFTPQFDIYSLGIVLFELVFGERPFKPENMMQAMVMHTQHPIPGMDAINPDVPIAIQDIIQRCLAKVPQDRFSSARELELALMDAMNNIAAPEDGEALQTVYQKTYVTPVVMKTPPHDILDSTDILVITFKNEEYEFPLINDEVSIGRVTARDVALLHEKVSREHVIIRREFAGAYTIYDMNSTNGTTVNDDLLSGESRGLKAGDIIRIADFEITIRSAFEIEETTRIETISDANFTNPNAPVIDADDNLAVDASIKVLEASPFTIAPGQSTAIPIELYNFQTEVDHFRIVIEDLEDNTYSIDYGAEQADDYVRLMDRNRESRTITLMLHPPANLLAGTYPFEIQVHSKNREEAILAQDAALIVTEKPAFTVKLHPIALKGWQDETVLTITNTGNIASKYALDFNSESRHLQFHAARNNVPIAPGQRRGVTIRVLRPAKWYQKWIGSSWVEPFEVKVTTLDTEIEHVTPTARIAGSPRLPQWMLLLLLPLCMLLIFALTLIQPFNIDDEMTVTAQFMTETQATANSIATLDAQTTAIAIRTVIAQQTRIVYDAETSVALTVEQEVADNLATANVESTRAAVAIARTVQREAANDLATDNARITPTAIPSYIGIWINRDEDERTAGAPICGITPNSPADEAGLQTGDVIRTIAGQVVNQRADIAPIKSQYAPGDSIVIEVVRDGNIRFFDLRLGPVSDEEAPASCGS